MFKVLTEGCEPTRGSEFSACVDLYAAETIEIWPGETKIIPLGISIDPTQLDNIPKEMHYLALHPRSSLRAKGLIGNTGIIDMDYEDEIKIILHNPLTMNKMEMLSEELQDATTITLKTTTNSAYIISKGDRIAQITLLEHKSHLFNVNTKEKREGGFGSTGEK